MNKDVQTLQQHSLVNRVAQTQGVSKKRRALWLEEYYEIVDEARPLSGFFPTHADFFFTEMHF